MNQAIGSKERRREFLKLTAIVGAGALAGCGSGSEEHTATASELTADSSQFWEKTANLFSQDSRYTYYNIDSDSTKPLAYLQVIEKSKTTGSASASIFTDLSVQRSRIANHLNVGREQVALMQSASRALVGLILNLDWQAGDAVFVSSQEHPSVLTSVKALEKFFQVECVVVQLPLERIEGTAEITNAFERAIKSSLAAGRRPRAMIWSSPTYLTGLRLPVRELAQLARSFAMTSICDAAHLLGMVEFDFRSLDLDFLVSSGSKWQAGPKGTGLVLMRKELATDASLFPKYSAPVFADDLGGTIRSSKSKGEGWGEILSFSRGSQEYLFDALNKSCDTWRDIGKSNISTYLLKLNEYLRHLIIKNWGENSIYSHSTNPSLQSALITFNPFHKKETVNNKETSDSLVKNIKNEHNMVIRNVRIDHSTDAPQWPIRISTPLWITKGDLDQVVKTVFDVSSKLN